MDYLFENATILDGSGSPSYTGDVLISRGKISAVGKNLGKPSGNAEGLKVIDASGKYLTPGFIDVHRHADAKVLTPEFGELELRQGLTTIINGNCGLSLIPCPEDKKEEIFGFLSPVTGEPIKRTPFTDFKDYMDFVPSKLPLNVGMLIGNGTVRSAVSGYRGGKLSDEEMARVHRYLRDALSNGAFGVSIGLQYAPEYNYDTNDLIKALEPMKEFDAPLTTHTRGDGDELMEALEEVITVAETLGIRLQISHFKNMGKRNWGDRLLKALDYVDQARLRGLDVNTDVYPYTFGSTQLIHILPTSFLDGGMAGVCEKLTHRAERDKLTDMLKNGSEGFENMVDLLGWESFYLTTFCTEKNQKYTGMSVPEIAKLRGQDPFECVYDLLVEEQGKIGMIDYLASEEDVRTIMKYKHALFISDSTYPTSGLPHPRVYGTFPRILATYVRDEKVLPIEEAVYKMTGMPADIFRIKNKGLIKEGYDADLCLFDLANIGTAATAATPKELGTGFDYVFVGGEPAIINDKMTGAKNGRKLFR